jgi:hypothetical protein
VPWSVGLHRGVWPPSEGSFTGFSFSEKMLDATMEWERCKKAAPQVSAPTDKARVYLGVGPPPGDFSKIIGHGVWELFICPPPLRLGELLRQKNKNHQILFHQII